MLDSYAVFTNHARDRLKEAGLILAKANYMLYNAEKEKQTEETREHRNKKYKNGSQQFQYRYGSVIFTLLPIEDRYTHEKCYLVLTVTDQNTLKMPYK